MEAMAFELKGTTAFFKKPDANVNVYFTYNHIHRVALLGLLGAILGYGGYTAQHIQVERDGANSGNQYPEFYQRLQHLQIAIVPHGDRGYFAKKIQTFNNSVGYASAEDGRNLVVREQWIEHPHWTIYLLNDGSEEYVKLEDSLLHHKSVYIPYLGKNDHPATIENPRQLQLSALNTMPVIHSLVYADAVKFGKRTNGELPYYYQEFLPVGLDQDLNGYCFRQVVHTNRKVEYTAEGERFYEGEGNVLYFTT